jgi:hypothetical protein
MKALLSGLGVIVIIGLIAVASWVTHFIWSLLTLFSGDMDTFSEVAIALLGIFIPFIGCFHGIYLWFS